jgi:hypothetical protein
VEDPQGKIPRMLKPLALALLVAWAAGGFLLEVNGAIAGWDERERAHGPLAWRFGTHETGDLARCLAAARPGIPAGSVVAFASAERPARRFQRWRWAAYLLPEDDVVPAADAAAALATYGVAFRTEIRDPRFVAVRPLPDGWLYRVQPRVTRP